MKTMQQILFGGKGPKAAFAKGDPIGLEVGGTVVGAPIVRQSTDLATGQPETWQDGNPKTEIVVVVQTNLRENADDDGQRRFFLRESSDQLRAVSAALAAVGAPEIEEGGYLSIKYTGDGVAPRPGFNAPRLHTATYQRPNPQARLLQQQPVQQVQQQVQYAQPQYVQQPVQQPVQYVQQPQQVAQQPVQQVVQQPVMQQQPMQPTAGQQLATDYAQQSVANAAVAAVEALADQQNNYPG
jgi:hypothetical protein